jgi:hypothetical protein
MKTDKPGGTGQNNLRGKRKDQKSCGGVRGTSKETASDWNWLRFLGIRWREEGACWADLPLRKNLGRASGKRLERGRD